MSNLSDREILRWIRQPARRQQGYRHLVARYQEPLYRHVRRLLISHPDTDDVLQNTFVQAFRHMDRFREDASLGTWLYRIATNEALGFLRRKKRQREWPEESIELARQLRADPYFDGDETQVALHVAIAGLPDKQRVVFTLRYFEEMPYATMAVVLDTSEGALKASYHHAQKKIEHQLRQSLML